MCPLGAAALGRDRPDDSIELMVGAIGKDCVTACGDGVPNNGGLRNPGQPGSFPQACLQRLVEANAFHWWNCITQYRLMYYGAVVVNLQGSSSISLS
jgi:hypothetical protein